MALPAPKVMTGARAVLQFNTGSKLMTLAYATNVGYRIAIPHAPVNVLGRYSAARHEPLGYDVTVTCGTLRFVAADGSNAPDDPALAIQPTVDQIMLKEDLEINILDRKTGKTVIHVARARLTDRGGNMGARDLLTENWTFVGIIADEGVAQDEGGDAAGGPGPNTEAAK
jgi:hypothetical protein